MRCLGTSPTIGEIERHLQVHKIGASPTPFNNQNIPTGSLIVLNYVYVLYLCSEKSGELDFSTFLTMMHRQMQQEDPEAEIFEAFRMTDKQKRGFIQASELRAKLTTLGEKLTNKEVDELFKEGNIKSNGIVNYKDFTQMVTLPPVDY
ncbi:Calmodulin-like protein 4 [Takifugu flavidus]|uniref:Calmodulin-like protein 4 n=1 Tax=Takifugu flavidus TaxID=433684 RepID=A0A5C6NM65_9TELE|nr:Calmodulin-like protein 4 [Takifugu flavidus]|eukprot:XP_011608264.1 PREDICTED: calmodulin-like protein 4 isoform X4 [Takifugu rubripes]